MAHESDIWSLTAILLRTGKYSSLVLPVVFMRRIKYGNLVLGDKTSTRKGRHCGDYEKWLVYICG